ncbi:hypothetical protein [Rathayibacter tanaceti]|uniref:hypothetical protein n=1 Tax=Rathayibacter tanaceti TaxID=1671680 RepID=UPI0012900A26|nr:hypothetical protein [Rathayibacter tanaceti]
MVIETTKQLDLEGWWPRNGVAGPDGCTRNGGKKGASYSYEQWAPRGTDFAGDARKVAAYWESLGMSVRIADSTPWPSVYAEGGPVLRAAFDTSAADDSYQIVAVAPCAEGDYHDLLLEDNAQRAAGEVLPGDEGVRVKPDPRETPPQAGPTPSE